MLPAHAILGLGAEIEHYDCKSIRASWCDRTSHYRAARCAAGRPGAAGREIVTLESSGTVQALAARSGKIVAAGTDREIAALIGASTQVVDLGGRLAVPGLIEGHGHFMALGVSKTGITGYSTSDAGERASSLAAEAVVTRRPVDARTHFIFNYIPRRPDGPSDAVRHVQNAARARFPGASVTR